MSPIKYMLRRLTAAIIDYGLYFLVLILYMLAFGEIRHGDSVGTRNVFHQFVLLSLWFVLFPVLESRLGYSLGKGLLDLKVVKTDGKGLSFWRALLRHLLDPVDVFFFLFLGMITIRRASYPRRLGDYLAGTEVVPDI